MAVDPITGIEIPETQATANTQNVFDFRSGESTSDEKTLSGIDKSISKLEETLAGNDAFTQMQQQSLLQSNAAAEAARTAASRQQLAQSGLSAGTQAISLRQDQTAVLAQQQTANLGLASQLAGRQDRAATSLSSMKQAEERITQSQEKFEYGVFKDRQDSARDSWEEFMLTFDFKTFDQADGSTDMQELESLWNMAYPGAPFPGVSKVIEAQQKIESKEAVRDARDAWKEYLRTADIAAAVNDEDKMAAIRVLYEKAYPGAPLDLGAIAQDQQKVKDEDAQTTARESWNEWLTQQGDEGLIDLEVGSAEYNAAEALWNTAFPGAPFSIDNLTAQQTIAKEKADRKDSQDLWDDTFGSDEQDWLEFDFAEGSTDLDSAKALWEKAFPTVPFPSQEALQKKQQEIQTEKLKNEAIDGINVILESDDFLAGLTLFESDGTTLTAEGKTLAEQWTVAYPGIPFTLNSAVQVAKQNVYKQDAGDARTTFEQEASLYNWGSSDETSAEYKNLVVLWQRANAVDGVPSTVTPSFTKLKDDYLNSNRADFEKSFATAINSVSDFTDPTAEEIASVTKAWNRLNPEVPFPGMDEMGKIAGRKNIEANQAQLDVMAVNAPADMVFGMTTDTAGNTTYDALVDADGNYISADVKSVADQYTKTFGYAPTETQLRNYIYTQQKANLQTAYQAFLADGAMSPADWTDTTPGGTYDQMLEAYRRLTNDPSITLDYSTKQEQAYDSIADDLGADKWDAYFGNDASAAADWYAYDPTKGAMVFNVDALNTQLAADGALKEDFTKYLTNLSRGDMAVAAMYNTDGTLTDAAVALTERTALETAKSTSDIDFNGYISSTKQSSEYQALPDVAPEGSPNTLTKSKLLENLTLLNESGWGDASDSTEFGAASNGGIVIFDNVTGETIKYDTTKFSNAGKSQDYGIFTVSKDGNTLATDLGMFTMKDGAVWKDGVAYTGDDLENIKGLFDKNYTPGTVTGPTGVQSGTQFYDSVSGTFYTSTGPGNKADPYTFGGDTDAFDKLLSADFASLTPSATSIIGGYIDQVGYEELSDNAKAAIDKNVTLKEKYNPTPVASDQATKPTGIETLDYVSLDGNFYVKGDVRTDGGKEYTLITGTDGKLTWKDSSSTFFDENTLGDFSD